MAVGPKMTREANTGLEGSPTHWANVGGGCSGGGGSTGFVRHTFLLHLSSASLLSGTDTCKYFAMPCCAVGTELLPIANVDVQVLEGSFDAVFVVFLLLCAGTEGTVVSNQKFSDDGLLHLGDSFQAPEVEQSTISPEPIV